jgi:FkbM family methyltransferase
MTFSFVALFAITSYILYCYRLQSQEHVVLREEIQQLRKEKERHQPKQERWHAWKEFKERAISKLPDATKSPAVQQPLPVNCSRDYLEPLRKQPLLTAEKVAAAGAEGTPAANANSLFEESNQGRYYVRWLNGGHLPPFYLSLHEKASDSVSWSAMEYGHYYEKSQDRLFIDILTDAANTIATPGANKSNENKLRVVDVGSGIGYYTLRSASVAASLHVPFELIAFEPARKNIARFCESLWFNSEIFFGKSSNVSTGSSSRVDIYQQGISNKIGAMDLHQRYKQDAGSGTFFSKSSSIPSSSVVVTTLDDFARHRGWIPRTAPSSPAAIHILKLDVELSESDVILGGVELLKSGLVWNIIMEIECHKEVELTKKGLIFLYDTAGYRLQGIGDWPGPDTGRNPWGNSDRSKLIDGIFEDCNRRVSKKSNLWWQHPLHAMKGQVVVL